MPCGAARICLFIVIVSMTTESILASNRIYSVRTDGSGLRIEVDADVVEKGMKYSAPNNSPDGRRLLFDLTPENLQGWEQTKMIVFDLAGESKGEVEDLDYGKAGRWSPDGKKIVFSVYPQNPKKFQPGVWIMNADGTDPEWMAEGRWPHWTVDGKSLITKNYNSIGVFMLKIDVETKEETSFLPDYNHQWQMHFSPDGKRALTYIQDANVQRLITIDVDGAKDSIIELATGDISHLGYSPNGSEVFYTMANELGGNNIYVASPDKKMSTKRLDVAPAVLKEHFCWMRDGRRIVFCAEGDLGVKAE